jgi:hypothetical protein
MQPPAAVLLRNPIAGIARLLRPRRERPRRRRASEQRDQPAPCMDNPPAETREKDTRANEFGQ